MNKGFWKCGMMSLVGAAVLGLAGCAGLPQPTAEETTAAITKVQTYESNHSFAWNTIKLMGFGDRFNDSYVDDKLLNKNATTVDWSYSDNVAWYSANSLLTGNPVGFGALMWFFVPTDKEYLDKPVFMGYLPKSEAADANEALQVYQYKHLFPAMNKAAEEMGFKRIGGEDSLTFERPASDGVTRGVIKMWLTLHSNTPKFYTFAHEAKLPEWLAKAGANPNANSTETYWVIGQAPSASLVTKNIYTDDDADTFKFVFTKDYLLRDEWIGKIAKYLPDNSFMYVPSCEDENGKDLPPYIANNKSRFYFVMPKSAEKK